MLSASTCGESRSSSGKRTGVVIVETDSTLRQFLHRFLSRIVTDVVALEDAQTLPRVADERETVDVKHLVVYDTQAGWEPLVEFRSRYPRVPIIVLLSPSAGVNHEAAAVIQPTASLTIPFRNEDLEQAVTAALKT